MKPLLILWQRLVNSEGETCNRCSSTYGSLQSAVSKLELALAPLGIEPILKIKEIDPAAFKNDPYASNRIWIADRPLEEWLNAKVGSSRCCTVCGDSNCRTVEMAGEVYESIPEELIVRSSLLAAAQLLASKSDAVGEQNKSSECCPDESLSL